ncbi:hypothetical protein IG631_23990 [Alternaria alternata]|nr:hypothetical protein IG631_23990 [Alternaria alternata]
MVRHMLCRRLESAASDMFSTCPTMHVCIIIRAAHSVMRSVGVSVVLGLASSHYSQCSLYHKHPWKQPLSASAYTGETCLSVPRQSTLHPHSARLTFFPTLQRDRSASTTAWMARTLPANLATLEVSFLSPSARLINIVLPTAQFMTLVSQFWYRYQTFCE